MSISIPQSLAPQLATFGEPLAEYITENEVLAGLKIVGIAILVALGQVAAYFILNVYYPIAAILTPIGFGAGLVMAGVALVKGRRRLLIFKEGLAEIYRDKATSMRWDDVAWLKERVARKRGSKGNEGLLFTYTLYGKNDTQIILTNYEKMTPMGETIFGEVNKRLLPRYTESYSRGDTVKFGDIGVSQTGINLGRGVIPWEEVEDVSYVMGKLAVRRSRKGLEAANHTASETPNNSLLRIMLSKILEERKAKSGA